MDKNQIRGATEQGEQARHCEAFAVVRNKAVYLALGILPDTPARGDDAGFRVARTLPL